MLTNSAEMTELDNGKCHVALRLLLSEDNYGPVTWPLHQFDVLNYTKRIGAQAWFEMLKRPLRGM